MNLNGHHANEKKDGEVQASSPRSPCLPACDSIKCELKSIHPSCSTVEDTKQNYVDDDVDGMENVRPFLSKINILLLLTILLSACTFIWIPFFSQNTVPLTRFGVMTDIQYADIENRPARYNPARTRFYRDSIHQVEAAYKKWTASGSGTSFVLQLGDIIDGVNSFEGHDSLRALDRVLAACDTSIPTFHVVGNHELYNFNRSHLNSLLKESMSSSNLTYEDEHHLYYSYRPSPGVKIIALDCYEVSVLGGNATPNYDEAANLMSKIHGSSDEEKWDMNPPLTIESMDDKSYIRFQSSNGMISPKQLSWLEGHLIESDLLREKVIVFGHLALSPETCTADCLLWNFHQVNNLLGRHPCVTAYLGGHAHSFGHACDANGIHHITFHGIIESDPSNHSFATLSLFEDRIELVGNGMEPNMTLPLRRHPSSPTSSFQSVGATPSSGVKDGEM